MLDMKRDRQEEEEGEGERVRELIRNELVKDWDDQVVSRARFKAFSGQRRDWEHRYLFWRHLILSLSRHLRLFIIRPYQVKNIWFNKDGLTPLCIDQVLLEMYNAGDLLRPTDLINPTSGRLSQIFSRVVHLVGKSPISTLIDSNDGYLILSPLLKEKADEVVKVLSENHWTSSCIITLREFKDFCGGSLEASAILSHLSGGGKAKYLAINKKDFIEGVKISLSPAAVLNTSSLDFDVLHLTWTADKLQQQLNVIDQRHAASQELALASLKSKKKVVALRHAREMKLLSQSRERCTEFLNRVEGVLGVIADAESTKKVSEAIQIGARAIKENKISLEEVQRCLQELDESIDSQKQVAELLESTPYVGIKDEDVEDEFKKLELEIGSISSQVSSSSEDALLRDSEACRYTDSLSMALSNLKLAECAPVDSVMQDSELSMRDKLLKHCKLEAA